MVQDVIALAVQAFGGAAASSANTDSGSQTYIARLNAPICNLLTYAII